jgi:CheY-like chemotaxis protein
VAKILVADDNSNVQKTVAHALTDLGAEVVSVNNGEAAIKKIADVSPDLILADIFMPVRNGYEVCEFVKKDSRFTHVPVVLLVGAFDPLDEREAQRVGADGVLKKPFVPPDPLITMVKTLLDRSLGERLVTAPVSKPAVPVQGNAGSVTVAVTHPPEPEVSYEPAKEELPPPVSRLSFGEGERPIAFGQLLDPPMKDSASNAEVVEPVDDEQILTSSRDASLGDPIFWKTPDPEPEAEAEDPEAEDDISSSISMNPWNQDEETLPRKDEEAMPPHAEDSTIQPVEVEPAEPFELIRDEQDELSSGTPTIVDPSVSILQDPASVSPLNVEAGRPAELAANPIEWMATAPPSNSAETAPELSEDFHSSGQDSAIEADRDETDSAPFTLPPPAASTASIPVPPPISAPVPVPALTPPPAPPQPKVVAPAPNPLKAQPTITPVKQMPEDTAHSIPVHDWADLAANIEPKPAPSAAGKTVSPSAPVVPVAAAPPQNAEKAQPAPPTPPAPEAPDSAMVEAVVQRVLDKMRPQVVDVITKEFLRPIVQALVVREVEKK